MKRVLVTRPRDEAEALAAQLEVMGFEPLIEPLIDIRSIADARIDWTNAQAVAFTSANGVRADAVASLPRSLTVFAVGKATAVAARAAGFGTVIEGSGTVEGLASLVVEHCQPVEGKVIHVSGSVVARDFSALLSASGLTVERAMVYEAVPAISLVSQTLDRLVHNTVDIALFFSPRTARTFVSLMTGAGLADKMISVTALTLSEAVAGALSPLVFATTMVAERPTTESLLAQLTSLKS
jgi:uroporphyrinogen-III synthase